MYKLIALDLDGTLLNSYGEISDKNKEAIKYAMNKGVKVILASGREMQTMKKFSLELGIDDFLIAGNGACVFDIQKNENIYESFVPKEKALQIIQVCKENSIFFNVYTNVGIITESLNYNVKVFHNENNFRPDDKRTNILVVDNIEEYVNKNEFKILKIIICDENQIIFNNIIGKLKEIENVEVLDVEHMSRKIIRIGNEEHVIEYFYTEVTNANTNKWSALKFLTQKLGIKEDEIVCIGDNMNDYEMITKCGLGITMQKSALEKLNIAAYVTEDNNSDGVAKAIYKFI